MPPAASGILTRDGSLCFQKRGDIGDILSAKAELLGAIGAGFVRFREIEPAEARVRLYGDAAVVTGRTRMRISVGSDEVEVPSRYTHVYARQGGVWRFVSAQGTRIA